jgi:hypothetical protein
MTQNLSWITVGNLELIHAAGLAQHDLLDTTRTLRRSGDSR